MTLLPQQAEQKIEIYGPTTIKGLLNALDGSFPNHGWGSSNVAS